LQHFFGSGFHFFGRLFGALDQARFTVAGMIGIDAFLFLL
jgi:hypothetical protein